MFNLALNLISRMIPLPSPPPSLWDSTVTTASCRWETEAYSREEAEFVQLVFLSCLFDSIVALQKLKGHTVTRDLDLMLLLIWGARAWPETLHV